MINFATKVNPDGTVNTVLNTDGPSVVKSVIIGNDSADKKPLKIEPDPKMTDKTTKKIDAKDNKSQGTASKKEAQEEKEKDTQG